MRRSLVEPGMKKPEIRNEGSNVATELETPSARAADPKRKAEYRSAIEASTARILKIAMTRGTEPDPDAA